MTSTNKRSIPCMWHEAGSITTQRVDLQVTQRDAARVEAITSARIIKFSPPTPGPYAMLLRFRADGAEDLDSILQLYGARGPDFYSRIAQLTVETGTGDTDVSTIHFVDTITPAEEDGHYDAEEQNRTDNRTAHYYCRVFGCDRFAIIATDLDSTTVYCDVCWLYE